MSETNSESEQHEIYNYFISRGYSDAEARDAAWGDVSNE